MRQLFSAITVLLLPILSSAQGVQTSGGGGSFTVTGATTPATTQLYKGTGAANGVQVATPQSDPTQTTGDYSTPTAVNLVNTAAWAAARAAAQAQAIGAAISPLKYECSIGLRCGAHLQRRPDVRQH